MDFEKKAEEVYLTMEANILLSDKKLIAAALEQAYAEGVAAMRDIAENAKHRATLYHFMCYCQSTVLIHNSWSEKREGRCHNCGRTIKGMLDLNEYEKSQNYILDKIIKDADRLLSAKGETK